MFQGTFIYMQAYNKTYIFFVEATMDFKAILPLLLAGNKNADKIMPILSAMSNGKGQNAQNSSFAQSANENASPLDAVFGDKNPAMAQILKRRHVRRTE